MIYQITSVLVLCGSLCNLSLAQESKPRTSPLAVATAHYKDTYLKITYGQPSKRGREIFGKLVPFGQVWRTGANEATEMTLTRDASINGNVLKAGTYSLFTIPDKDRWTIIFNADVGQWGSYNYNPKVDNMRFEVPILVPGDIVYEQFTIAIEQKNDKAEVAMLWDKVKVIFQVQFNEPQKP